MTFANEVSGERLVDQFAGFVYLVERDERTRTWASLLAEKYHLTPSPGDHFCWPRLGRQWKRVLSRIISL